MKLRAFWVFSLLLVMLASFSAGCRPYRRGGLAIDVDIHSKGYHKDHRKHHHDHDDHDDHDDRWHNRHR